MRVILWCIDADELTRVVDVVVLALLGVFAIPRGTTVLRSFRPTRLRCVIASLYDRKYLSHSARNAVAHNKASLCAPQASRLVLDLICLIDIRLRRKAMAKWVIQGDDASTIPPDPSDYVPGPMPKFNPPKAPNGNDGGALWWDHDDPGVEGHQGYDGIGGAIGQDGLNGGDTPQGVKLIIPSDTTGEITLVLAGGNGQPGGKGGVGGPGGEGQDGGDGDDEQPAGNGGKGGRGGFGGVGGKGGDGGTAFDVDVVISAGASYTSIIQQTHQGLGGRGGSGGDGGPGGPGGRAGSGGAQASGGDPVGQGPTGPKGKDGHLGSFHIV